MIDDIMITCLFNSIAYVCRDHECDFFLAGSRRFKFHSDKSDLDIVIQDNNNIETTLKKMGFSESKKTQDYPTWTFCWRGIIHVIMLPEPSFTKVREEHDQISDLISNTNIIAFVKELKSCGIEGSLIYKCLVNSLT